MPCSIPAPFSSGERRRHFVQEALELTALIPRGQPERHVAEPLVEVRAELLDALLGAAGHRPTFDEGGAEIGGVVAIQELLRLDERGLAVLVDVDVVVEGAAEASGIAALLAGHRLDPLELTAELVGAELVAHPAVRVPGDPPERALHDGLGGARPALPREPGGIARDPDRTGLLHGFRLHCHALEAVEPAGVSDVLLGEELAQDDDAFLEPPDTLARVHVHHPVLEGLSLRLLVGPAETDREPGSPTAGRRAPDGDGRTWPGTRRRGARATSPRPGPRAARPPPGAAWRADCRPPTPCRRLATAPPPRQCRGDRAL